MSWLILIAVLFLHVMADFRWQGIMAEMKSQDWWKKQKGYYDKYKNDYIPPLFWHSFHWSCCILLPYLVISQLMHYALGTVMPSFLVALAANTLVHMFIDHQKANCKSINLVQDQLLHILQMLLTHVCLIDILAV